MIKNKIKFKIVVSLIVYIFSAPVISHEKLSQLSWLGKFIGKEIIIDNPYGNVRMRYGGENNAIEYIAVIQNLDAKVNLVVTKETKDVNKIIFTVIDEENEKQDYEIKSRLDLTFFIPKDKNILVKTRNGLIEAKGLLANISAKTIDGDIVLSKNKGTINSITDSGEINATITRLKDKSSQQFISQTGDINIWVNRKAHYLIEVATSSDIITDFSMKIKNLYNQEPNKKGIIKLNKKKSKIIIKSKRGRTAIRGFGKDVK